jgi:hypothetical protein
LQVAQPRADGSELGPDQRATLDLIAGRGLDYAGIARVTGIAEPEVRARARDGLTALGGADPGDAATAYLLGVAKGGERRRALASLRRDPAARTLAVRIAAELESGWEGFRAPPIPAASGSSHGSLAWIGAGILGAAVIGGILALAGVFDGGNDEGAAAKRPQPPAPVRITLAGSGTARGVVTIGVTVSFRSYMQLDLGGLPPAPAGSVYLLWVDNGTGHGFPLPTQIDTAASGEFHRRYNLSPALAPLLSLGRALDLLAVDAARLAELSRGVTAAGKGGSGRLPARPGTVVLAGEIPRR